MIKTIKIDNKEVRLDNNIGWALIYRDQFGHDIVSALMPMMAGAMDVVSGIVSETDGGKDVSLKTILEMVNGETFLNAMVHIGSFEFVDFVDITWTLAKNADDSIPEPKEWIKQFDSFPLDVIAPAVFKLIFKGMISSKNLKRLSGLKNAVQPLKENLSNLTQSSSPDSKED